MLRYYLHMLLGVPRILLRSPKHARAVTGNLFLLGAALICGFQFFAPDKAAELHEWLKLRQSSPSVAAIALTIAVVYLLLLGNYEHYAALEKAVADKKAAIQSLENKLAEKVSRNETRAMVAVLVTELLNQKNTWPGANLESWLRGFSDLRAKHRHQIADFWGEPFAVLVMAQSRPPDPDTPSVGHLHRAAIADLNGMVDGLLALETKIYGM